MPIYEYRCPKCGDFEAVQKMSDKALAHCPTCRRKVTKLMSSTSFQLKGSGWYVTDYARKSTGETKGKKSDDKSTAAEKSTTADTPAASDAGDTTKSDSTPSSKPDAASSSTAKKSGQKPAA